MFVDVWLFCCCRVLVTLAPSVLWCGVVQRKRERILQHAAPRLFERKFKKLGATLAAQATPGHAWHADHIIPVYQGGGLCEMDNMRTLCVACHQEVTLSQTRARAAEKRRQQLKTPDIRDVLARGSASQAAAIQRKGGSSAAAVAVGAPSKAAGGNVGAVKVSAPAKRKATTQVIVLDSDDDEDRGSAVTHPGKDVATKDLPANGHLNSSRAPISGGHQRQGTAR